MNVADFNEFRETITVQPNPGRQIRLAALVIGAQHRVSKTGKKYGQLTLEDFTGKMDLTLFSDNYVKFANYFEMGMCLFITGRCEYWESRKEWNFKVSEICLLETIKKTQTKGLVMTLDPRQVTTELLDFLDGNLKKYPGKTGFRIRLQEPKNKWDIGFYTMGRGLEMNDEMTVFLESNPDIKVQVEMNGSG
jgi:DNA polymerase III subunit alpha